MANIFTDLTTPLATPALNAVVPMVQSTLTSGTISSSGAGISISIPALGIVVFAGGVPTYYPQNAATVTHPGGAGTYAFIDLTPNAAGTAAYPAPLLGTPGSPPTLTAAVRLGYLLNNGGTSFTFTQTIQNTPLAASSLSAADEAAANDTLTPTSTLQNTIHRLFYQVGQVTGAAPPGQSTIPYDPTEAITADTLSGSSKLVNNMNRTRHAVATLTGQASFAGTVSNTKAAVLSDGTNAGSMSVPYLYASGGLASNNGLTVSNGGVSVSQGGLAVNAAAVFGGSVDVRGSLIVRNLTGTPSFTPNSGVSAVNVSGNPQVGNIQMQVYHTWPAGTGDVFFLGTLNFGTTFSSNPYVFLFPNNNALNGFAMWSVSTYSTQTSVGIFMYIAGTTPLGSAYTLGPNYYVGLNYLVIPPS